MSVDIRWIAEAGVSKVPAPQLAEFANRAEGVTWVHLDHSDELGMALLVAMIKPRQDDLQGVLDLFQTRVSNELNRFVRKITAFGTVALSWTVVAGIYGTNFATVPELMSTYGYPMALGVMLPVSIVLWYLFHRRHWL